MDRKVVGHKPVLKYLERCFQSKSAPHTFLFVGPEHVGKLTVAQHFLCKQFGVQDLAQHSDLTFLTREENSKTGELKHEISVEQVRDLRNRLAQSSWFGGQKAAIIENAELLSSGAANALLKILEEPPGNARIILTASSPHLLPRTIVSRAAQVRFPLVGTKEMIEAGIPEAVAMLSGGRPGVAYRMLESEVSVEQEVRDFLELLSAPVWKRAATIEPWFGKKKAHALSSEELNRRVRVWKLVAQDLLYREHGADGLVRLPFLRENTSVKVSAARLAQKLCFVAQGLQTNANARFLLEEMLLSSA